IRIRLCRRFRLPPRLIWFTCAPTRNPGGRWGRVNRSLGCWWLLLWWGLLRRLHRLRWHRSLLLSRLRWCWPFLWFLVLRSSLLCRWLLGLHSWWLRPLLWLCRWSGVWPGRAARTFWGTTLRGPRDQVQFGLNSQHMVEA